MGKTTGFLEYQRLQEAAEAVEDRVKHYREFLLHLSDQEARDVADIVERLGDDALGRAEKAKALVALSGIVGARARRAGTAAVASGRMRADLLLDAAPHIPIRDVAARMPTYVTLKEVKKRWGHGQEDVFPVSQFEKLWVDMTALPEIKTSYAVVPRQRGQQLKDQAQLDGWLRDGSADFVNQLCAWS